MKRILACTGSLLAVFCSVAWAQDVKVDWDKGANFTGYHTYAWRTGTPAKNPLMGQRIVEGIDKQLAAKGYQQVDINRSPDLIVLYHASTGSQTQLNTMGTGCGWSWGGSTTTTVSEIPTGQLSVDIGDFHVIFPKAGRRWWMPVMEARPGPFTVSKRSATFANPKSTAALPVAWVPFPQ